MTVTMSILSLLSPPNEQLELALGIDKVEEFKRWYQWEALGKLCSLKFYPRKGENLNPTALISLQKDHQLNVHLVFSSENERDSFLNTHQEYPQANTSVETIPDLSEGSATLIRQWYHEGMPDDGHNLENKLKELNIHPAVHQLIIEHQLFGLSTPKVTTQSLFHHKNKDKDNQSDDDFPNKIRKINPPL